MRYRKRSVLIETRFYRANSPKRPLADGDIVMDIAQNSGGFIALASQNL